MKNKIGNYYNIILKEFKHPVAIFFFIIYIIFSQFLRRKYGLVIGFNNFLFWFFLYVGLWVHELTHYFTAKYFGSKKVYIKFYFYLLPLMVTWELKGIKNVRKHEFFNRVNAIFLSPVFMFLISFIFDMEFGMRIWGAVMVFSIGTIDFSQIFKYKLYRW